MIQITEQVSLVKRKDRAKKSLQVLSIALDLPIPFILSFQWKKQDRFCFSSNYFHFIIVGYRDGQQTHKIDIKGGETLYPLLRNF